jgi:hypothetical protein
MEERVPGRTSLTRRTMVCDPAPRRRCGQPGRWVSEAGQSPQQGSCCGMAQSECRVGWLLLPHFLGLRDLCEAMICPRSEASAPAPSSSLGAYPSSTHRRTNGHLAFRVVPGCASQNWEGIQALQGGLCQEPQTWKVRGFRKPGRRTPKDENTGARTHGPGISSIWDGGS